MRDLRTQRTLSSLGLAVVLVTGAAAPASRVSELDAARSKILVEVGKAGAFSFIAGHSHQVEAPLRGTLSVNPQHPESADAAFEVLTGELRVLEDGEPPQDVPQVQETMASPRVLDVLRYPTIMFQSRAVQVRQQNGNALDLVVTGDLTLHGTTRSIVLPVHAHLAPDVVTARGAFAVKQTDFGMKPITVAGGAVAVKDELKIQFTIVSPVAH